MTYAAIAVLVCSGCSFATMRRPHGQPPECSSSRVPAVIDAAVAVASPFIAYAMVDNFLPDSPGEPTSNRAWKVFGRGALALGDSCIRASGCERAKRDDAARSTQPPISPP